MLLLFECRRYEACFLPFLLFKSFVWTSTVRPAIPANPSPSPPCPCACTWCAIILNKEYPWLGEHYKNKEIDNSRYCLDFVAQQEHERNKVSKVRVTCTSLIWWAWCHQWWRRGSVHLTGSRPEMWSCYVRTSGPQICSKRSGICQRLTFGKRMLLWKSQ